MPVKIDGRIYYRTAEVCQIVGIGKSTLFRWIRQNIVRMLNIETGKGGGCSRRRNYTALSAETKRIQKNHVGAMRQIPSILGNKF
jgi:transposase-like protein